MAYDDVLWKSKQLRLQKGKTQRLASKWIENQKGLKQNNKLLIYPITNLIEL